MRAKWNASIELKRIGNDAVLYIYPRDEASGVALSRFYLLNEVGKINMGAYGPCDDRPEEDCPVAVSICAEGKSKRFSREIEKLLPEEKD